MSVSDLEASRATPSSEPVNPCTISAACARASARLSARNSTSSSSSSTAMSNGGEKMRGEVTGGWWRGPKPGSRVARSRRAVAAVEEFCRRRRADRKRRRCAVRLLDFRMSCFAFVGFTFELPVVTHRWVTSVRNSLLSAPPALVWIHDGARARLSLSVSDAPSRVGRLGARLSRATPRARVARVMIPVRAPTRGTRPRARRSARRRRWARRPRVSGTTR